MTYTLHYEAENPNIPVTAENNDEDLLPKYAHYTDAGADLRSSIDISIPAGQHALVPTGVALAIPEGFVGLVHPRSGLALRHQVTVLNTPGTIDADYRGEIKVILINHAAEPFEIKKYDRIAQLVVQRVEHAHFNLAYSPLQETGRGAGGFGSTGTN